MVMLVSVKRHRKRKWNHCDGIYWVYKREEETNTLNLESSLKKGFLNTSNFFLTDSQEWFEYLQKEKKLKLRNVI